MKIISKFKDYYDNVSYYGVDESLLFLRNQRQEDLPLNFYEKIETIPSYFSNNYREATYVSSNIIGYCGKFYLNYQLSFWEKKYVFNTYSLEEIYSILKKKKCDEILKDWNPKYTWGRHMCHSSLTKAFQLVDQLKYDDLFFKFKSPLLLFKTPCREKTKLIINPNLKELGFVKIKNPPAAYQEISSYISGVLGAGKPSLIEISDKDQLYKKGFNDRSFKTDSPGKKRKRRKQ